ncbi:hypothetical protein [Hymenobacter edaphi]|uniref:hypothetical protein n=1 Tax=Hymenobacter edaphi TaxID=2211146 RepID=UPI001057C2A9|nr:hypothetical protein [Hymenobacter edaphi]
MSQKKGKAQAFEHEIYYSQSSIAADGFWVLIFLGLGIFTAVMGNYWGALFLGGAALFISVRAVRRARVNGPVIKFGRSGIWTAQLGFKTWHQVVAVMQTHTSTRGATSLHLSIAQRGSNTQIELQSIPANDLAVDVRTLRVWLKKYTVG